VTLPPQTTSVIICTHNPRPDYLRRTLASLQAQTVTTDQWELIVVDNASRQRLADSWDLSWHPRARHVREEQLGLTPARLRAIEETSSDLLIFVDDDNVLASDYLAEASSIFDRYPELGVYGAGVLAPDFESEPPQEITPQLGLLALRTVSSPRQSRNPADYHSTPWGAGLCVRRSVAHSYSRLIPGVEIITILDRRGAQLFSGGDDLFSWVASSLGLAFGIFPQLKLTHLIGVSRVQQGYILRLVHTHAFSSAVRHYVFDRLQPPPRRLLKYVRLPLHALKNGLFSMRCQLAWLRGETQARRFIHEKELKPMGPLDEA
jgi:hypothetical protein